MSTRKQIRDIVILAIEEIEGNDGRVHGYQRETVTPTNHVIEVYFDDGDVEHPVAFDIHQATLNINIMSPAVTNIDDALDDLASPIESALAGGPTLGGLVHSCKLSNWSYDRGQDDGLTGLVLSYSVRYQP